MDPRPELALALVVALLAGTAACVAPPPTARYRDAYDAAARLEREGHPAKAAAAYGVAADRASRPRYRWQAAYRQARELEKAGRRAEALALYLAIADEDPAGEMAPRCVYYAARMAHEDGESELALERLRRVVETYPDSGLAPQAVRRAVQWLERLGESERALALLVELEERLRGTDVGDNLLYHQALLHERAGRWEPALELFERMAELYPYPNSSLFDDAMWRAGNLALERGQPERALGYLRSLTSRREDSLGTGSYYTEWTDDAQLLIGRILLEQLGDRRGAAHAFEELATFPDSVLADDGLYWAARVYGMEGDRDRACRALERMLEQFPYSNLQRRARAARSELDCSEREAASRGGR